MRRLRLRKPGIGPQFPLPQWVRKGTRTPEGAFHQRPSRAGPPHRRHRTRAIGVEARGPLGGETGTAQHWQCHAAQPGPRPSPGPTLQVPPRLCTSRPETQLPACSTCLAQADVGAAWVAGGPWAPPPGLGPHLSRATGTATLGHPVPSQAEPLLPLREGRDLHPLAPGQAPVCSSPAVLSRGLESGAHTARPHGTHVFINLQKCLSRPLMTSGGVADSRTEPGPGRGLEWSEAPWAQQEGFSLSSPDPCLYSDG